ncbi:hypothetical protein D3C73_848490 [compost metagenome]
MPVMRLLLSAPTMLPRLVANDTAPSVVLMVPTTRSRPVLAVSAVSVMLPSPVTEVARSP